MSWISKLFGKRQKSSQLDMANGFYSTRVDELLKEHGLKLVNPKVGPLNAETPVNPEKIMVKPDLAFYKSRLAKLKEIEGKLQVTPEDYKDLSFDDSIDLNTISFTGISDEAKRKIIEIIMEDRLTQINKY